MAGIGGQLISSINFPRFATSIRGEVAADSDTGSKHKFREKFAADSAEAGVARTLKEQRLQAEKLVAEANLEGARDVYERMAHSAKEVGDRASEAIAVLGLADCLANAESDAVDVELICGMYRYAGDAAGECGDADIRFSALIGCAKIRWSCRMFERSEQLWEAAVDVGVASGNWEHAAFAKSQLAKALLQDQFEVVDESKQDVGHVSREGETPQLRGGSSPKLERALRLLEEVAAELPDSASTAQKVSARANLANVLRSKESKQCKRRAENQLVLALECLTAAGGDPELQRAIEASILELYEENMWLMDGKPDAEVQIAKLKAKREANQRMQLKATIEAGAGRAIDPEERRVQERAAWANEKLEAMRNGTDGDDDSDADINAAAPAHPQGNGWQK